MLPIAAARPTPTSDEITTRLEEICKTANVETLRMSSMAAHDAMSIARVAPTGLFFIPSLKGVSHRPDEDSQLERVS
jgi:N-carbamoyl-L-amino-acid hydrolase